MLEGCVLGQLDGLDCAPHPQWIFIRATSDVASLGCYRSVDFKQRLISMRRYRTELCHRDTNLFPVFPRRSEIHASASSFLSAASARNHPLPRAGEVLIFRGLKKVCCMKTLSNGAREAGETPVSVSFKWKTDFKSCQGNGHKLV